MAGCPCPPVGGRRTGHNGPPLVSWAPCRALPGRGRGASVQAACSGRGFRPESCSFFHGWPSSFKTFVPLPRWTVASFPRCGFFFPRLQSEGILRCLAISCQARHLTRERTCLHSRRAVRQPWLCPVSFPTFRGRGVGVPGGASRARPLCGSLTPTRKRPTRQAAKGVAAYFRDPGAQPE